MKNLVGTGCFALVCVMSTNSFATAETFVESGDVCFTGEIEYIGTTEKDMAWAWKIDWTFLPDDKDPMKAASGKCFGSGALINGKPEPNPYFCTQLPAGGGSFMLRGVGGRAGNEGFFFGGTQEFEGIHGSFTGGPEVQLPADKGRLTACRRHTAEYSIE